MSRYLRPRRPGASIFFTVCLAHRASDLLTREIGVLRQAVRETRAERPFAIEAWVVLPDHMHCVWTLPEGDAEYSVRMGAIKARFSRELRRSGFTPTLPVANGHGVVAGRARRGGGLGERVGVNPDLRGEAPIWQKRFWERHIRDDADFAAHLRYCWMNPVKHGLVSDPGDWPFTSYRSERDGA
jgi:putative transposase